MSEEEIFSEHQLVEAAKADISKFDKLYDRYFQDIFYFIFRRTDDETVAGDLTSQTFIQAMEKLKKYRFMGLPFSAWLFRIATNEVNKYYRKLNRKRVYSLEEQRVKEIMTEAGEETNDKRFRQLIQLLNELPTNVIEIMELRFFEGRSFKEISFILKISESSAKMRIYRTLEKLRKKMLKTIDHG